MTARAETQTRGGKPSLHLLALGRPPLWSVHAAVRNRPAGVYPAEAAPALDRKGQPHSGFKLKLWPT